MYLDIHIFFLICTYLHTVKNINIYIYIYVDKISIYISISIYIYKYIYIYICTYTYAHICMHIYIYTYICICKHMICKQVYTNEKKNIYINIYAQAAWFAVACKRTCGLSIAPMQVCLGQSNLQGLLDFVCTVPLEHVGLHTCKAGMTIFSPAEKKIVT